MRKLKYALKTTVVVLALALLTVGVASADSISPGQVVTLSSPNYAGDIGICASGTPDCSAMTSPADFVGVGVFYNSALGPFTPDQGIDADSVTLLGGSDLHNFLTNFPGGFSGNAVFLDASATGQAVVDGFTFLTSESSVATPEPATLWLLGFGSLALGLMLRRRAKRLADSLGAQEPVLLPLQGHLARRGPALRFGINS